MNETWTSLKLIQWTADYFEKMGIPNPRLDAELLLAHVLKAKRIDLYTQFEKTVLEKHLVPFKELLQRRAKREPLQYILGETEFWGCKIEVTPDVLIPRPETELLVEWALKEGQARGPAPTDPNILDIGTGTGCIAIALATHIPTARVIATDHSKPALEVAQRNIASHHLADRVALLPSDLAPWKSFEAEGQKFDLIISNPPYIRTDQLELLQPEVRDFEPRVALNGGKDGLDFYRRITQDAPRFLKPDGRLLLEIGEDQGEAVMCLMTQVGLVVECRKDWSDHDRVVIGKNRAM